jgi:hypothetical protein
MDSGFKTNFSEYMDVDTTSSTPKGAVYLEEERVGFQRARPF